MARQTKVEMKIRVETRIKAATRIKVEMKTKAEMRIRVATRIKVEITILAPPSPKQPPTL